jgi:hypothetical protein
MGMKGLSTPKNDLHAQNRLYANMQTHQTYIKDDWAYRVFLLAMKIQECKKVTSPRVTTITIAHQATKIPGIWLYGALKMTCKLDFKSYCIYS